MPVFYLEDAPSGLAFGLAQMFRLPYRLTLHQAISNSHADHLSDRPDLAELIFGCVRKNDRDALRGRISFEPLWLQNEEQRFPPFDAVLMGPRPSFYPFYIAQSHDVTDIASYQTLMDDGAELAGWKRYPLRPQVETTPPGPATDAITSRLEPLEAGSAFTGRVHVHNLRPVELGAILWAITWGGNEQLRHALGLGKSLGLGQVSCTVTAHFLEDIAGNRVSAEFLTKCRTDFEQYMQRAIGDPTQTQWRESEQIFHLLSLANPAHSASNPAQIRHPVLGRRNEFTNTLLSG